MELKVVRNFIDRLNDENILYCHWKSNQHVRDAFTGIDDIDMLIEQGDILKLNIILNELGYKRFRLPEKRAYIGIEDYLGFDKETGKFAHLHLHYQLTLGEKFLKGYQLPYSRSILKRRIFNEENKIYTTSYEDEMWLLLLRAALKLRHRDYLKTTIGKDVCGSSTHREYEWLKDNLNIGLFQEIVQEILGDKICDQMVSIIKSGLTFSAIWRLNRDIRKGCSQFKSFTIIGGVFTRWNREYFRVQQEFHNRVFKGLKSYRRTPISGGKIIAFLGPDGAGKSTVINEVNKRLEKVIDVNKFYLGSGDGESSLLRKPLRIIYSFLLKRGTLDRKSKIVDKNGETKRIGEERSAGLIRSIGKLPWTYTLSRERKNKLIKMRKFRSRGYVVLTDRYPQTQVLNMCDGPRYYMNNSISKGKFINKLLIKSEKNIFEIAEQAKPDLVIILKVSSEIAYERKPDEINIDSHKNLMDTILTIDFGDETKKIIVNANQKLGDVIIDVLSTIWECM